MKYVGQTGKSFSIRYKKSFRDFKYANCNSKFAHHLLDYCHSIGPIENIMEVLDVVKKDGYSLIPTNVHFIMSYLIHAYVNK
jgi:hypothetical protein